MSVGDHTSALLFCASALVGGSALRWAVLRRWHLIDNDGAGGGVPSDYSNPRLVVGTPQAGSPSGQQTSSSDDHDTGDAVCLVQLSIPATGSDGMPALFSNDMILSKAVKETSRMIYVRVVCEPKATHVRILKYISEIYSRLWDEMVFNNRLNLQCFVYYDGEDEQSQAARRKFFLDLSEPVDVLYLAGAAKAADVEIIEKLGIAGARVDRIKFADDCSGMFFVDCDDRELPHFAKVALGGTFDKLHNGHRKLLTIGATICTGTLIVGIMADELLQKKNNANLIDRFFIRKALVEAFVGMLKPDLPSLYIAELHDPFGPALSDPDVEAIVVSSETIAGASKINKLRADRGFAPLQVVVIRRSDVATLSSTYLRTHKKTN